MKLIRVLLCTLALCVSVITVSPPATPQPNGEVRKGNKRMAKLRKRLLKKKVGLTDEEIARVTAIAEAQQDERRALEKTIGASRRELGRLIRSESDDQDAYAKHLDALQVAYRGMDALRDKQVTALREVLEPSKQAKLFRAMEIVKRRLERKRRGRRKRGR